MHARKFVYWGGGDRRGGARGSCGRALARGRVKHAERGKGSGGLVCLTRHLTGETQKGSLPHPLHPQPPSSSSVSDLYVD